jgi:hypothetical protein
MTRAGTGARDDGSITLAVLLTIVGFGLSVAMLATTLQQVAATRVGVGRERALDAARTGLQVALGQIRAARDAAGNGVVDDLPCAQETGAAALAGADGHGGRYDTRLTYLLKDPRGHTASWIQTNGRPCADQPSGDPRYAYIQSTGRSSDGVTRTLFGTYVFMAATDPNVPGGQIRSYPAAGHNPLCFDAGPDPKPGTVVLVQPCDSTVPARQRFAYTPALTLVSLSSFATVPDGLCVDGGRSHAVGVVVTLQPCSVPAGTNQQWALDQGARFQAFGTNKKLDGFCITVENDNTGGSRLVLTDDSVTTGTGTCNDGNLDPG